jgi:integrase
MNVATAAPTPTTAEASSAFGRETRPPRTRSPVASATFPTAASVAMEWAYRHASDAKPRDLESGIVRVERRPNAGPNHLRHTFATEALAAGVSIFEPARLMGTSLKMIDRTYGHLARDSE